MQSPRYEYSRAKIHERFSELMALTAPYGITVRYALKANPHPEILAMAHAAGIHFDASSSYEAANLLELGIPGERISLSSQQSPHNLPELLAAGVHFIATSKKQLALYFETSNRPNTVAIRINPNVGYGHSNRTTTGGMASAFGIWHEYGEEALALARAANVTIDRIHIHIGSGADATVWKQVMQEALAVVTQFPDATCLDIGGGFKVARYGSEHETNMAEVVEVFSTALRTFNEETGRSIALEIEPGTYAIAHAGTLVASVDDIVDTGKDGYTFLRLNTGMNDFLRSTMYGARHHIEVMNDSTETCEYVVVGHNCESGDIFTPVQGNPEEIETRNLKKATIGDEVRIYDAGAYGASMRAKGYNSFPDAQEVLVD